MICAVELVGNNSLKDKASIHLESGLFVSESIDFFGLRYVLISVIICLL